MISITEQNRLQLCLPQNSVTITKQYDVVMVQKWTAHQLRQIMSIVTSLREIQSLIIEQSKSEVWKRSKAYHYSLILNSYWVNRFTPCFGSYIFISVWCCKSSQQRHQVESNSTEWVFSTWDFSEAALQTSLMRTESDRTDILNHNLWGLDHSLWAYTGATTPPSPRLLLPLRLLHHTKVLQRTARPTRQSLVQTKLAFHTQH